MNNMISYSVNFLYVIGPPLDMYCISFCGYSEAMELHTVGLCSFGFVYVDLFLYLVIFCTPISFCLLHFTLPFVVIQIKIKLKLI